MKVTVAKTAGFCMGVRRAVEMAFDAANATSSPICTYGPLIHNPQVLSLLEEKGIFVISEIPQTAEGLVIIRAHGIPPRDRNALAESGFEVIDATCPRVVRVQSIISRHARQGYAPIIVGDREHPEVVGLLGYAGENGYVVESMEALESLPDFEKAIIVTQTTQNAAFFEKVSRWARQNHPDYKIFNTICDSTEKRQAEIKALAADVDAVVVVGGYSSGNTRRLAEIAAEEKKTALHVETAADVDIENLTDARRIGITAGASTPNWIIKQVYQDLEARLAGGRGVLYRFTYTAMRFLVNSNLYLAAGAGSLTLACMWLLGLPIDVVPVLVAALYILAMHTANQMIERQSDRYNDPYRAEFYQKNRHSLTALALFASTGALAASWWMGPLFFVIVLCMSVLGVVYNMEAEGKNGKRKRTGLKSLPGSKTVLTALAWGIVAVLLPAMDANGYISGADVLVFAWAAAMVLVRTAYFDIMDMQGSRIMGRGTIPILFGEKRTIRLLKAILAAMAAALPMGWAFGILEASGMLLVICPVLMGLFLHSYERKMIFSTIHRGFVMESFFLLAGVIAGIGMLLL